MAETTLLGYYAGYKFIEFYGEFTEDLDTRLIEGWKETRKDMLRNHSLSRILIHELNVGNEPTILVFRVPGATRGCIYLDHNQVITGIEVHNDISQCYVDGTEEYLNEKWVGTKMIFIYKGERNDEI